VSRITLRISDDLNSRLGVMAACYGESRNALLTTLLEDAVQKWEKENNVQVPNLLSKKKDQKPETGI